MQTLDRFLVRPCLRDGAHIVPGRTSTALEYRSQSCDIEHGPDAAHEVSHLLDKLLHGATEAELAAACPGLAIAPLLAELDKLGLLTDSSFETPDTISGSDLHSELMEWAGRWSAQTCHSRFYTALVEGDVTPEHLIRYAIEYYQIVRASIGLIAPSLGHVASDRTRRLLSDFVRSEMGHDLLMAESLAAVGITPPELHGWIPLPATFTLCSTLGVLAVQDPLSFKCALFLFEQPSDTFTEAFVARAQASGLPDAFWKPLVHHAAINDEGHHGDITVELLADVSVVSREEALVAKKHVGVLIETLALLEDQILDGGSLAQSPYRWNGELDRIWAA
jgi:hypothetical protein